MAPSPPPQIQAAITEALARFSGGEHHLAVHPHCGTNMVTAGMLVGLTSFLSMLPGDQRARRTRLPLVLLLSTLALLLAQPLGPGRATARDHRSKPGQRLRHLESTAISSGRRPFTGSNWSTALGQPCFMSLMERMPFHRASNSPSLMASMGDPATRELNTVVLDGRTTTLNEIRHHCDTMPFLADRRLVLVKGLLERLGQKGSHADEPIPARPGGLFAHHAGHSAPVFS